MKGGKVEKEGSEVKWRVASDGQTDRRTDGQFPVPQTLGPRIIFLGNLKEI